MMQDWRGTALQLHSAGEVGRWLLLQLFKAPPEVTVIKGTASHLTARTKKKKRPPESTSKLKPWIFTRGTPKSVTPLETLCWEISIPTPIFLHKNVKVCPECVNNVLNRLINKQQKKGGRYALHFCICFVVQRWIFAFSFKHFPSLTFCLSLQVWTQYHNNHSFVFVLFFIPMDGLAKYRRCEILLRDC